MASPTSDSHVQVINYDAGGFDYRQFWNGRDYEHWAEARVINRLLRQVPPSEWFVDLGGGFGRNVPHYLQRAAHVVLVDYSWTNLANAEAALLADGKNAGRVFLIRGNIYHLPFRAGAFEVGATIRVLHHLAATDAALAEMSRVISQRWLLDVPIKNHLLARLRASLKGQGKALNTLAANDIGTADEPFYNYHLDAIRQELTTLGWNPKLIASVANFRRWERAVPGPLRAAARPLVYGAERLTQPAGRGWWGPAQFLWQNRTTPAQVATMTAPSAPPPAPWDQLAPRLQCPACQGELAWTPDTATCQQCQKAFGRKGAIWDFVVE